MQRGVTLYFAPSFQEAVQGKEGDWEKEKKKERETTTILSSNLLYFGEKWSGSSFPGLSEGKML